MEEAEKVEQQEPTTLSERFSGFAAYHFILVLLMDGLFWFMAVFGEPLAALFYEIEDISPWLFAAFAVGIYLPAGMIAAKRRGWTCPRDSRVICLAILQPAAVAWIWVLIVIFSVLTDGLLALCVFFISMLFAAPSSILVLCFSGFWASGSYGEGTVKLFLIGLLAGFLPPLLFALGSFWQSARMERRRVKPMERDTQY